MTCKSREMGGIRAKLLQRQSLGCSSGKYRGSYRAHAKTSPRPSEFPIRDNEAPLARTGIRSVAQDVQGRCTKLPVTEEVDGRRSSKLGPPHVGISVRYVTPGYCTWDEWMGWEDHALHLLPGIRNCHQTNLHIEKSSATLNSSL